MTIGSDRSNSVVHRWATDTKATSNVAGTVIKKLRNRLDVPHRFPNRRYMYEYLTERLKLDGQKVEAVIDGLWRSYYDYNVAVSSDQRVAS